MQWTDNVPGLRPGLGRPCTPWNPSQMSRKPAWAANLLADDKQRRAISAEATLRQPAARQLSSDCRHTGERRRGYSRPFQAIPGLRNHLMSIINTQLFWHEIWGQFVTHKLTDTITPFPSCSLDYSLYLSLFLPFCLLSYQNHHY